MASAEKKPIGAGLEFVKGFTLTVAMESSGGRLTSKGGVSDWVRVLELPMVVKNDTAAKSFAKFLPFHFWRRFSHFRSHQLIISCLQ